MSEKSNEYLSFLKSVETAMGRPLLKEHDSAAEYVFETPYEVFRKNKKPSSQGYSRDTRAEGTPNLSSDVVSLICEGFRHLPANPSDKINRQLWKKIYVHPQRVPEELFEDFYLDPTEVVCVNTDRETTSKWVEGLATELEEFGKRLELYKKHGLIPPSTLLMGWRGSGKTTFQNYAFTRFIQQLHNKRVVWVRLDLASPGLEHLDLEAQLNRRICKILIKYYSQYAKDKSIASDKENFDKEFWSEKEDNGLVMDLFNVPKSLSDIEPNLASEEFIEEYIGYLKHLFSTEDSVTDGFPSEIYVQVVRRIMEENNVKLLVVVDGLDQIGLTDDSRETFERWLRTIQNWVNRREKFPYSYVIAMRPDSYAKFIKVLARVAGNLTQLVVIDRAPVDLVWKKKILRIRELAKERNKQIRVQSKYGPKPIKINADYIEAICWAYLVFLSYSLKIAGIDPHSDDAEGGEAFIEKCLQDYLYKNDPKVVETVLNRLEELFFPDYRRLFDSLVEAFSFIVQRLPSRFFVALDSSVAITGRDSNDDLFQTDFSTIARDFQRFRYVVIDALLLESGRRGREFIYHSWYNPRYRFKRLDAENESNGGVKFSYVHTNRIGFVPNLFQFPFVRSRPWRFMLLAQIRILQILDIAGSIGISESDLSRFLRDRFRYLDAALVPILKMMKHNGLLRDLAFRDGYKGDEVAITRKGNYFLFHVVQALEYVSLVLQATPLPRIVFSDPDKLDIELFPVRPYDSYEYRVMNKVASVIGFTRCVCDIEKAERVAFDRDGVAELLDMRGNFRNFGGTGLCFSERFKASVFNGISSTSHQMFETANAEQMNLLKRVQEALDNG